jgi:hypothetical protein
VRDAVERQQRGELAMFPPTAATLDELAAYDTVADVLAASEERVIIPLLPKLVLDGDDVRLEMPAELPTRGRP